MAKLIKKNAAELGDVSPDSGFSDVTVGNKRVISGKTYEAKSEAQRIVAQAQDEAEQIIANAQSEAAQFLEQAQAEATQLQQDAQNQGFEQGRQEGVNQLSEVIATTAQRMQQIEAQAIPQLRDLALSIARKILGRELEFAPESVVDLVKQALAEKARQRREIFLRVNPEDLALIREHRGELLEVLSRCKDIGLREDPDVARHGVIIETDAGVIDAQLESQLQVFEHILKDT